MRQQLCSSPATAYRFPGEYVKAVRKSLKMSQQDAAKKADMSGSALSKLESGHHMQPRNIFKLSEALGIDPKDLIWEEHHNKADDQVGSLDELKRRFSNWEEIVKQGMKELLD